MNRVEINVFGELNMIVDGKDITHQIKSSKKKMALLEYLIINKNKMVSVGRLVEVLWSGSETINMENTLKTLVSRLRKDLEQFGLDTAILTKPGAYMWNPDLTSHIDVFRMEELCNAVADVTELTDEAKAQFEEVLYLYTDDLLVNSSLENWIAPKSFYYHDLYLNTVYKYIGLLSEQTSYGDVIRVCKTALEIDAFDSMLNLELMTALLKMGKNKEALAQYQNTTNLHYTHLGLKPSDEILNFYKQLIKGEKSTGANIEEICSELKADQAGNGAFVCEYAIFKDVYHLNMRNLKRLGRAMFLALVTVYRMDHKPVEALEMEQVMGRLLDALQNSLRRGDTVVRYSPLQYVVLLPSITHNNMGRMVIDRVKSLFYSNSKNTKYVFAYKVAPLDLGD